MLCADGQSSLNQMLLSILTHNMVVFSLPHGSVLIKEPYWSVRPSDPAADYWLQHWGCWTWWKRVQEEARCVMCDRGESFESRAVTAEAGSMCEACLFCIYPSTAAACTVLFPEHRNTQTPSRLALRSTPQLKGGWRGNLIKNTLYLPRKHISYHFCHRV